MKLQRVPSVIACRSVPAANGAEEAAFHLGLDELFVSEIIGRRACLPFALRPAQQLVPQIVRQTVFSPPQADISYRHDERTEVEGMPWVAM